MQFPPDHPWKKRSLFTDGDKERMSAARQRELTRRLRARHAALKATRAGARAPQAAATSTND